MTHDEEEGLREAGRKQMKEKLLARFAELENERVREAEISGIILREIIEKYKIAEEDALRLRKLAADHHMQILALLKRNASLEGMLEALKKIISALGHHLP